jgi:hypothetical protein
MIPIHIAAQFIDELQGLLSYIYLLQASIDVLAKQNPFKEEIVVYRGLKHLDPELTSLYDSVVGQNILWRSFTSTSRSLEVTLDLFISEENGI